MLQYGIPKTAVQRYMYHYGVDRRQAERLSRSGAYLPPRGTGLQRAGLERIDNFGIGAGVSDIINEIKEHPIAWGLIALVAIWVFTRKD